ncbi:hypothetical protein PINS_up010775 [Pythium insidiosum]|nr:hypothetical protein PINS_up010775 [Pythium insidiosum]
MMCRSTRALVLAWTLGLCAVGAPRSAVAQDDVVTIPDIAKKLEKIPNGASLPQLLGVDSATGEGQLNAFGVAFQRSRYIWTTALCEEDTDGDGQTNGQELGDPCCSWRETRNLAYLRVSNPSSNSSKVNANMFVNIECTKSEEAQDAEAAQDGKGNGRRTRVPTPSRTKVSAANGSSGVDGQSVADPASNGDAEAGSRAVRSVQAIAALAALGQLVAGVWL